MSKPGQKTHRCVGTYERSAHARGFVRVAGVDEVGRGALFGPVYAAAVILSPDRPVRGLCDSKQIDSEEREALAAAIRRRAVAWGIGAADVYEIDRINILQASLAAMKRAIAGISPPPDYLLLDAVELDLPVAQEPLIHGDARSQCIAAASILAKTARDECMRRWDEVFPQYGLARNKGYSTDEHIEALARNGPTMLHRFSFEPVRAACPWVVWNGYETAQQRLPFAAGAGA